MTLLGEHKTLASGGVMVYMINHSLMKVVLFLCAGIIICNTGWAELNDIKGFARNKPVFAICFGVAGFAMAGIPFLSGYIGKTLIHESIVEYAHMGGNVGFVEIMFIFSGGLTLAYVLKLFVLLLSKKQQNVKSKKHPINSSPNIKLKRSKLALLCIPTLLIIVAGIFPNFFFKPIVNYSSDYLGMQTPLYAQYFTFQNMQGSLISIGIGIALYFGVVRTFMIKKGVYVKPLGYNSTDKHRKSKFVFSEIFQIVFGGFSKFFSVSLLKGLAAALNIVLTVVFRFISDLPDIIIYLMKIFLFIPNKEKHIPTADELKIKQSKIEAKRIVFGNLSFGLLMASVGIFLIIMYVLVSSLALGM